MIRSPPCFCAPCSPCSLVPASVPRPVSPASLWACATGPGTRWPTPGRSSGACRRSASPPPWASSLGPLSSVWRLPLEERTDSREETVVPKAHKLVSNVVAVLAAFGTFWVLGRFFGGGSGLPRIDAPDITNTERLWGIPVALVGVVFGYLYLAFEHGTHRFFARLQEKYPILVSTLLGGLILGVMGTVLPLTMFSGEHEIHTLMETYLDFAPWVLILTGTAKLLLTNVCIQSGWRGGHFFPVIFCGISIGYGVAMLSGLNIAFCLGVVTASLLGVIMRKPLAVTLLLLLCFPARVIPWLFIGAYVGSLVPLGKLAPQKH